MNPGAAPRVPKGSDTEERTPIQMLHDRVLVNVDSELGERRSTGGILIPATAEVGGNVRSVEVGDRVLFDPEDKAEIEVHGETYIVVRERDLHAVAADRLGDAHMGLYL